MAYLPGLDVEESKQLFLQRIVLRMNCQPGEFSLPELRSLRIPGPSFYGDHAPPRHPDELGWSELENGVRIAGGSPDFIILEQILVDEDLEPFKMTDGRDPSDDKARMGSYIIRIRLSKRFGDKGSNPFFVHPVRSAGDYQERSVGPVALKNEGFCNLPHLASHGLCRL